MSEYQFVERPLLQQLASMGWQIIEHNNSLPHDPSVSLRTSFREVSLKSEFIAAVKSLNSLTSNTPNKENTSWLTNAQCEQLFIDFSFFDTANLVEANQTFLQRLYKWQVDSNELTGEQDPVVNIIDFDNWQNNRFVAISQFRIDTPGGVAPFIVPDVVLFVNGLPLVVIECKDINSFTSDAMYQAIEQLRRYADLREDTIEAGLKEGEQKLFWTNQFMIATYGRDCKVGTITSTDEYYFNWKCIHPDAKPYTDNVIQEHRPQEQLVQGMLHPQRLLDITRSYTLFMDAGPARIKVICRYQQYRAVCKIIEKMCNGNNGTERSGVIWHTQGSGKSLTMVFLVRRLRREPALKSYKILMINDRTDLDKQLGETAALTGETVYRITSVAAVREKLAGDSSTLNMVMVHKFREEDDRNTTGYVADALGKGFAEKAVGTQDHKAEYIKSNSLEQAHVEAAHFDVFDVVNSSEKILLLIDEAHRTQRSGKEEGSLSDNLFDAFPNAARLAFTGTPLIADHHTDPTWKRFGGDAENPYIDKYKLQDAVDDGATLQILYEGRTAESAIYDKHGFDTKFENLFKNRSDEELAAIRKKYGATGDILEAEKRIEEIAKDLVRHYIRQVLISGFKAQVVCHSKQAAIHYATYIRAALDTSLKEELAKTERNNELIERLAIIDLAVIISSDGTNEKAVFKEARKRARELNAVENFKKKFDLAKPETGMAFLIVCDMLLTGFDAPVEQVMYIDKKLKEHNLLQTIARVNRTYKDKTVGYVVDYIGLTENLKEALTLYAGDDRDDILASFKDIASEIPVLQSRFRQLIQLFEDKGVSQIEALVKQKLGSDTERYKTTEAAVNLLEDIKTRDSFNVYLKKFMGSMDIVLPNRMADPFKIPMYQFAHIQAKARERYKDDSINIAGAGAKVRKLVSEHLISLGINPKVPPVELFSSKFIQQVNQNKDPRAVASEMEHAVRKHCKVNEADDPVLYKRFSEKLEEIVKKYNESWEQMALALIDLRAEIDRGRTNSKDNGPFFDLIADITFGKSVPTDKEEAIRSLTAKILELLADDIRSLNFWERPVQVSELEGKIRRVIILSKDADMRSKTDLIVTEVLALARRRERDILNQADGKPDKSEH
jgi:type I restriction enzyme R subunit